MEQLVRNFRGLNSRTIGPGSMRVYNMRFCPYAQRILIALALKDIPSVHHSTPSLFGRRDRGCRVEVVNVDLRNKADWFLARNPLGKVPILETNDTVVYESGVCNEWLDEAFPNTRRLLPKDPVARAHQKMLMERLTRLNTIAWLMYRKAGEERAQTELRDTLQMCEGLLEGKDFFSGAHNPRVPWRRMVEVGGPELGWADVMEWPWFERLGVMEALGQVSIADYPNIAAYRRRMSLIPEVAVTMRPVDDLVGFTKSFVAMINNQRQSPDYDFGLESKAHV